MENFRIDYFLEEMRRQCEESLLPDRLYWLDNEDVIDYPPHWAIFLSQIDGALIIYKPEYWAVDLVFPGYGNRLWKLKSVFGKIVGCETAICRVGKDGCLRRMKPEWDTMHKPEHEIKNRIIPSILDSVFVLDYLSGRVNFKLGD